MVRLVSKSQTRAKILEKENIKFIQNFVEVNENSFFKDYKNPKGLVYAIAKEKMALAHKIYSLEIPLIVADTIVSVGNKILGKAKNSKEAYELLMLQSGREVDILTCTIYKAKNIEFLDLSATKYFFRKFDKKDIENYIKSKEWEGKAGACMVEGFCKKYIKKQIGLESCAKGLTIEKLKPFLKNV